MNPIEKAARSLCHADGHDADDISSGAPHWTIYLLKVMTVVDALHEPSQMMKEAGSEIIRHVGAEECDAANVWRFMIDALHQDGRHAMAATTSNIP